MQTGIRDEDVLRIRYRLDECTLTSQTYSEVPQRSLSLATELGGFASHIITHPHTSKRQSSKRTYKGKAK